MNMTDIKRLIRIYNGAEEVGLYILAVSVEMGLHAYARNQPNAAKGHFEDCLEFCDIAMGGTAKAQEFAPGAKVIILKIIEKMI